MKRMLPFWLIAPIVGVLALSGSAPWALAVDTPAAQMSLREIYQVASSRQKAIRNLKVKYSDSSRTLVEVPGMTSRSSEAKIEFMYLTEWRFRREDSVRNPGNSHVRKAEFFNGDMTLSFDSNYVRIQDRKKWNMDRTEIYVRHVLEIPLSDEDKADFDNRWFYPNVIHVAESKYRVLPNQEEVDGAWCHVLDYPGHDRIWVDPKLGCAWRRRERATEVRGKKVPESRYQASDFRDVSGIAIPTRCTIEGFPGASSPPEYWNNVYSIRTIQVEQIRINDVTERDFDATVPAGTWVFSETEESYRVPGDRSELLISLGREAKPNVVPRTTNRLWFLLINALAILGIFALILYRRFRSKGRLDVP